MNSTDEQKVIEKNMRLLYGRHQLPHQEECNAGIAGHRSIVSALSVPRFAQPKRDPAEGRGSQNASQSVTLFPPCETVSPHA